MILIADSGSTKTDWKLVSNSSEMNFQTPGINPVFQDKTEIVSTQQPFFTTIPSQSIQRVYFYGAGCLPGLPTQTVHEALNLLFPQAIIEVADDMLGAARALLHNSAGIACILGTGANSCLYNGRQITDKIPALGFILGDEGSGAYLGKELLNQYFKRALPDDLNQAITKELKPNLQQVIQSVYRKEYPNRYLAQYAKFIGIHQNHPHIQELLKKSFATFFEKNVQRYPNYENLPVALTGSIAFHFSEILKEVAKECHIQIKKILANPIQELAAYHQYQK